MASYQWPPLPSSGGSGTVSSVTFTGDGTVLSSTPSSAVTTTGTLTATLNTQAANEVLAGPASGSAAAPTFRALVTADLPAIPATPVCYIWEQQASGVNGNNNATFTLHTWTTRFLTNIDDHSTGITISNNQMVIPAGTYDIYVTAPAFNVNYHKTRLYDVTNSAVIMYGTAEESVYQSRSSIQGRFTTAGATIEVDHICSTTVGSGALGLSSSTNIGTGVIEVYTQIKITKVG